MAVKRFDKRLNFLFTSQEHDMLLALAEREGLTGSDVVRQLVRRAYADAFGEPKPASKKKGKRKR